MNIKVSIIIPIYNGEKYIENCFESIKNQTLNELEIIFVDDGSTDNSLNILNHIKRKNNDMNIKIIQQINKGPALARKEGISIANGVYIGFIDIDDCIKYNMYESLYSLAENYNLDIAVCGMECIDANGNVKGVLLPDYPNQVYLDKNQIRETVLKPIIYDGPGLLASQINKIYKKSLFETLSIDGYEHRRFGEDNFFNQQIIGKIDRIGFINEALYNYLSVNTDSLSSIYLNNSFDLLLDSINFRSQRLKEWGLDTIEIRKISNGKFCDYMYTSVIKNEFDRRNNISIIQKIKNIRYYILHRQIQELAIEAENSKYASLISHKKILLLTINAYFDSIIRPRLSSIKSTLIKIGV